MSSTQILYNTLAGDQSTVVQKIEKLKEKLADKQPTCIDVKTISSYADFIENLSSDDNIYLCGGDGTINRFINGIGGVTPKCNIYYYAIGSGNDFLRDLGKEPDCEPFCINDYIVNLPIVIVNGKENRFLNNVGFGIDGYCTVVGDKQKQESDKAVNYTAIAIKGLLFHYKPTNATITVDGKKYTYKKVWLAPTMNGRFYGGGMMATPAQDRLSEDGKVSLMLMHKSGKIRTLLIFASIFKGEHIKHEKTVAVHTGYNITVEFDAPAPLQIDGETIPDVTRYEVRTVKNRSKEANASAAL